MIVTFGCQKGGVAKTTLACSTVAELLRRGEDVILVDADPDQGSSSDWARWREESIEEGKDLTPAQYVCLSGNISSQLKNLQQKYEYVIVDVPGLDSLAWRSSMTVADTNVAPYGPSMVELNTLSGTKQRVDDAQVVNPDMRALYLLTRCDTKDRGIQAKQGIEVFDWFASEGAPIDYLPQWIHFRKAWANSFGAGFGITEWKDQAAKAEFMYLFDSVFGGDNDH